MDENGEKDLPEALLELLATMGLKKETPEEEATFIAGLDQQRAKVRAFVATLIGEVREHQQTCTDTACVGVPIMASSTTQLLKDPKSVLAVLWETLHQLANLPDYNPHQELEEVLKL